MSLTTRMQLLGDTAPLLASLLVQVQRLPATIALRLLLSTSTRSIQVLKIITTLPPVEAAAAVVTTVLPRVVVFRIVLTTVNHHTARPVLPTTRILPDLRCRDRLIITGIRRHPGITKAHRRRNQPTHTRTTIPRTNSNRCRLHRHQRRRLTITTTTEEIPGLGAACRPTRAPPHHRRVHPTTTNVRWCNSSAGPRTLPPHFGCPTSSANRAATRPL